MPIPTLVTISFSHFCEKARWALDRASIEYRESAHLPLFHVPAVRRAGGKHGTPLLVTGEGVLRDSSDILAWIDRRRPELGLFGKTPEERAEVLRLEELFDVQLGPHTRRWAYFQLLADRRLLRQLFAAQTSAPRYQRSTMTVLLPLVRVAIRRSMKIDAAGAARSFAKIEQVFAQVGALLSDGRKFLVGDSLTAADLTFAALAAPAVFPDDSGGRLPRLEELPPAAAAQVRAWRAHPAGEHAERLVREHRGGL